MDTKPAAVTAAVPRAATTYGTKLLSYASSCHGVVCLGWVLSTFIALY